MSDWIKNMDSPIDVEVLEESALARAQAIVDNAITQAGVTRAELARRMGCDRSLISRMLSGDHNLTVRTMARALAACGFEIKFEPVILVWNWKREGSALAIGEMSACAEISKPAVVETAGLAYAA